MQKFSELIRSVIKSYFNFNNYSIFSLPFRVLVILVLLPVHLMFIFLFSAYAILYFVIMMLRVPADFIRNIIDEDKNVTAAAQFVVYLVAYPSKFAIDLTTASLVAFLAWVYFFVGIYAYIGSLGNIKLQAFIMTAQPILYDQKPTYKFPRLFEILIFAFMVLSLIGFGVYTIIVNVQANNQLHYDVANDIVDVLERENISAGYSVKNVYINVDEEYDVLDNPSFFSVEFGGSITYYTSTIGQISPYYYSDQKDNLEPLDTDKINDYIEEILGE